MEISETEEANIELILDAKDIWFDQLDIKEVEKQKFYLASFLSIMRIYDDLIMTKPLKEKTVSLEPTGSYQEAKSIWEKVFKKNYIHSSRRTFDQIEHQLYANGAGGPYDSAIQSNNKQRKVAMSEEEIKNILILQSLRIKELEIRYMPNVA